MTAMHKEAFAQSYIIQSTQAVESASNKTGQIAAHTILASFCFHPIYFE
jgi:hypothetical protein